MAINPATIRSVDQARAALAALVNGFIEAQSLEYVRLLERVISQLRRLMLQEIDLLIAEGEDDPDFVLSLANIQQRERVENLIRSMNFGLRDWADIATQRAVQTAVKDLIPLGEEADEEAIRSQLPREMRDFARAPAPEVLEAVVEGTERRMDGVLQPLSRQYAREVNDAIIDGIALGQNPRRAVTQLTLEVQRILTANGTDALRFFRTEMLNAYRQADLVTRTANEDVLRAWMWYSAADERTCVACWAMHGTEHATTEFGPDDHPNGRCVAIPIVRPEFALAGLPEIPTRDELWARLSPAQQAKVLGPTRSFLFNSGRIGWQDLSRLSAGSEQYRPFHQATSVRDLMAVAADREPAIRGGMVGDHLQHGVAGFPDVDALGERPVQYGMYHQWLVEQYDFTDEQQEAIDLWISAEGFQVINGVLRGDPTALEQFRSWAEANGLGNLGEMSEARAIALIDLMMRDNPIAADVLANFGFRNEDGDEGLRVFRAFSDESMVMRRWQIGDRYQDDGYMATSLSRSFAENWVFDFHELQVMAGNADPDSDPFGAAFTIEVPAGSRGLFIGGAGQQELLLARGTTLEVVGFDAANRPIFRVVSDTAAIPPPQADFYSWMRDGIQRLVGGSSAVPPIFDLQDAIGGLPAGTDALKRSLHLLNVEAQPTVVRAGRTEDMKAADLRLIFDRTVTEAELSAEWDKGVEFTAIAIDGAEARDRATIALIDTTYGEAVLGALNYMVREVNIPGGRSEERLIVEWLGSTRIAHGAGAGLMAEAIREAANLGLGIQLQSTEESVGFYERIGLRRVDPQVDEYRFGLTKDEVAQLAAAIDLPD